MRKIDTSKAHYVGLDQRIAPRSDVYVRLPFVMPDGEVMSFGPSKAADRLITVSVSALDERPLLRAWPWTAAADQSPPRNAESSRDSISR